MQWSNYEPRIYFFKTVISINTFVYLYTKMQLLVRVNESMTFQTTTILKDIDIVFNADGRNFFKKNKK